MTLTDATTNLSGLAFDRHGNLWVAKSLISCGGSRFTSNVVEFAASQLMASGAPTPAVTISPGGVGLAFAP